ncbi:MAG: hypothetical protein ABJG15_05005 [Hyphomonadaceae bacterium]
MTDNNGIVELTEAEIGQVSGASPAIGAATLGAASAVAGVALTAFTIGLSIGRSIGKGIVNLLKR